MRIFGSVLAVIGALVLILALVDTITSTPAQTAAAQTKAPRDCKTLANELLLQNIAKHIEFKRSPPLIEIDAGVWQQMDRDTKVGVVKMVACAAGGGKTDANIAIDVQDYESHKMLAKYRERNLEAL